MIYFLILFFNISFSFFYQWDIAGYLSKKVKEYEAKQSFDKIKGNGFVDIYKNSYDIAIKSIYKSKIEAIDGLYNFFSNCNERPSKEDIKIAIRGLYLKYYDMLENKTISGSQVVNSCKKILKCFDITSENDYFIRTKCTEILGIHLDFFYSNSIGNIKLETKNRLSEVLYNGTLEDGPYDLLVDIYEIKKILFEEKAVKKPDILKLYSINKIKKKILEKVKCASLTGCNADFVDLDLIKALDENQNYNNENNLNNNQNNNQNNGNINQNNEIQNIGNASYENRNPLEQDNNLTIEENDENDEFREKALNLLKASVTNNPGGCLLKSDSNQIIGVSICLIPGGKQKEISDRRMVYSIEDILNQILKVVTMLKDSGQLMKHAYTDEFWETRLQDIKLNRIFVFDLVISKKPLFPNRKTQKKYNIEKEKQNFELINRTLGIQYEDRLERNKYVVLAGTRNHYHKKNILTYNPNILVKEQEELKGNIQIFFIDFIKYNTFYWEEVIKILLKIRQSSVYLKEN